MLARIRKSMEKNDEGFTLIELLVVMIIIGILAAIAIPAFLAQRDKGYQTAIKNDLKNVSIAEESYATDNNGDYLAQTLTNASVGAVSPKPANLIDDGAKLTTGVAVDAKTPSTTSYCLVGTSSKTKSIWYLSSADNVVTSTKPAGC